ncbi:MAG: hypothetical protein GY732_12610 [Gammaproteobacteria bacterium]|nr:hypothetical protein [Gammaproteobacteria bacterium]
MLAGCIDFLILAELLDEYREVSLRPRIKELQGLSINHLDNVLTEIVANGIWRKPASSKIHPTQATAIFSVYSERSDLITGDQLLLKQPTELVSVITPSLFGTQGSNRWYLLGPES